MVGAAKVPPQPRGGRLVRDDAAIECGRLDVCQDLVDLAGVAGVDHQDPVEVVQNLGLLHHAVVPRVNHGLDAPLRGHDTVGDGHGVPLAQMRVEVLDQDRGVDCHVLSFGWVNMNIHQRTRRVGIDIPTYLLYQ